MTIYRWLKEWFNPKAFGSNNGTSLSRRLMALLIVACAVTLVYDGFKRGLSAPWAATATGLATTLAGIWGVSKLRGNPPPPADGGTV